MDINITSSISAMGAINGFVIAIFLFFRGKKYMVRLPLIIYIVMLSTYILGIAIKHLHISDFAFRCVFFLDILYGILIYMYVRNKLADRFVLYKKDFLFVIPIILAYTGAQILFLESGNIVLKWIIELTVEIIFVVLALKLIIAHSKKEDTINQNRSWIRLKALIIICLIVNALETVIFILYLFDNSDIYLYLYLNILYAIAIYVIGYNEIYSLTTTTKEVKAPIIANSGDIQERLLSLTKTEKPYLNKDVKITDIAQLLNEKPSTISNVINNDMGLNFCDFINSYRVSEAKKLLKENNNLSIEGVGYEVGFKAKSTFYSAFKKFTGKTPTKYIESIICNKKR